MLDSRFPWMCRPESAPDLGDVDRDRLRAFCDVVHRRTGASGVYNRITGEAFFFLGRMENGVTAVPIRVRYGIARFPNVENVVEYILLGRVPRWKKDLWAKQAEKKKKDDDAKAVQDRMESIRPTAEDHVSYLSQRSGMGKRWRKSAVVSGVKES